jgi:hypothetical protein
MVKIAPGLLALRSILNFRSKRDMKMIEKDQTKKLD